jgi:hypothetical protein
MSTDWDFTIEFRSVNSVAQFLFVGGDAVFAAPGVDGILTGTPASIDLVAIGGTGYVAFDGELVAVLDLSDVTSPGDVVLSAVNPNQADGGSLLQVVNLTIYPLNGDDGSTAPGPPANTVEG